VFSWNGTQWVQKGNDIDGYTHQRFGSSLCLSADGNAFAAGSEMADLDGFGLVKVYKWDGTQWIQKGQDFNGYSKFDFLGSYTIELVNNSNTIIIGGMGYYDPLINGKCFIEVYDWNGSSWIMRGNRIVGYNSGGYFGRPLSSSEDGNIIIASETISGIKYARAYSWYGASWELMGSEIKNVSCCRLDEDGKKFIGYYYDTTTLKTVLKVYSYEQSGILALVDAKEPFMFYPNPVKEHLYFTKELNSPTILNATGEVVIQMSGNVKQVYLKELKPGLYFLKADNQLEKFLIE
jgi:hypothetical protein